MCLALGFYSNETFLLDFDNLDGIERIRALKHIIFDFLGWRYQACYVGR